jgi:peptide/nickel transport system ATP-binding protein
MSPVLAIEQLHVEIAGRRRGLPILRGVDLTISPGEVHGLVGESGAGKTMVARAALAMLPRSARITEGSVRFEDLELMRLTEAERRRLGRRVGLVPQDPMTALNPVKRIGRQITAVLRLHLGLDRAAARERALSLLDAVHIREPARVLRQYPHELSGGMRQRVLIAIAFACEPALIIADEPTTALDVTVQRQILRLVRELQRSHATAVLFITHNLGVVSKICDSVSVIHAGRIVEHAPVARLFAAPKHAYTQALMRATPRYDRPAEALQPVPDALAAALAAEASAYDRARRAPSHA